MQMSDNQNLYFVHRQASPVVQILYLDSTKVRRPCASGQNARAFEKSWTFKLENTNWKNSGISYTSVFSEPLMAGSLSIKASLQEYHYFGVVIIDCSRRLVFKYNGCSVHLKISLCLSLKIVCAAVMSSSVPISLLHQPYYPPPASPQFCAPYAIHNMSLETNLALVPQVFD